MNMVYKHRVAKVHQLGLAQAEEGNPVEVAVLAHSVGLH